MLKNRKRSGGGGKTPPITLEEFNKYVKVQRIGQGAFGTVYKVLDDKGDTYALKCIDYSDKTRTLKEWETMWSLCATTSPIVKPIAFYDDEANSKFNIIMEYVANGDLENYYYNSLHGKSYKIKLDMAKQLVDAIVFIHSKNIVHGDLKFENVLIDANNNVKISDFGISCLFPTDCKYRGGTRTFMDPMLLFSEGHTLSPESDVYSLGVMLFQIFADKQYVPKTYMSIDEIVENFKTKHIEYNSNDIFMLIFNMLQPLTPKARLTIVEIQKLLQQGDITENTISVILKERTIKLIDDQSHVLKTLKQDNQDTRNRLYGLVREALKNSLYTVSTNDVISELIHFEDDNKNHKKTIADIVKDLRNKSSTQTHISI